MREMNEQERLAQLVGVGSSGSEDFDSADLLTKSLLNKLGRPSQQKISEIEREIAYCGDELDYRPISTFSSNGKPIQQQVEPQKDANLIKVLKIIYSGLVDTFERSGLNSGIEGSLIDLIGQTGYCLNYLGENVNKFEPLKHLSGLQAPNMVKSASKVIETTLSCYKIGSIVDHSISDDGSEINIVFSGKYRNMVYKAFGVVSAKSWEGNEAIDYIYTPGSGKMSVKSFEKGKWVDKCDNYKISWTLEENNINQEDKVTTSTNNSSIDEFESITKEEISEDKKEVFSMSSNNEDDDDEEIGNFPISDG